MSKHQAEYLDQQADLVRAWEQLLDTEAGRLIMADIQGRTGIYAATATGNSQVYWQEGRRALGLELMQAYLAPEQHVALIRESALRDERLRDAMAQDRKDGEE